MVMKPDIVQEYMVILSRISISIPKWFCGRTSRSFYKVSVAVWAASSICSMFHNPVFVGVMWIL